MIAYMKFHPPETIVIIMFSDIFYYLNYSLGRNVTQAGVTGGRGD